MAKLSSKAKMQGDEILSVSVACANFITALSNADSNADGKTSTQEIVLAILSQVGGVSVMVTQSRAAFLAFKMSSTLQRREVISAFAAEFDLQNDKAEEQIETVLTETNEIVSSVLRLVAKFKKNKQVAA